MIETILHNLGLSNVLAYPVETRRGQVRRSGAGVTLGVGNKTYILRDWSAAGMSFDAEAGSFKEGETFDFTLKFPMDMGSVEIPHSATVTRIEPTGVAAAFSTLDDTARRKFSRVVEALVASDFSNSHVA